LTSSSIISVPHQQAKQGQALHFRFRLFKPISNSGFGGLLKNPSFCVESRGKVGYRGFQSWQFFQVGFNFPSLKSYLGSGKFQGRLVENVPKFKTRFD